MVEGIKGVGAPPIKLPWYRRLHWRLLIIYAAIVIPIIAILSLILDQQVEAHLIERNEQHLSREATLIARLIEQAGPIQDWDRFSDALVLGRGLNTGDGIRVTLIDVKGRVMGDSEVGASALGALELHGTRPEVKEALERGVGRAVRSSDTLGAPLIYIARRIDPASARGPRVVRLACAQDAHVAVQARVRQLLWLGALVTVLTVLLAGFMTSRVISRPMAEISAASWRIASSVQPASIDVDRDDELGVLAHSINALSSHLTARLAQAESDKALMSTILDGMAEGVVAADAEGRIMLLNPVARHLLGLEEAEVIGMPLKEIHGAPELMGAMDEATRGGAAINREMVLQRVYALHLAMAVAPLRQSDQIQGAVAVLHDITALRRLERIRRDFVANVSHELRTPLATITGYAETLLAGPFELDAMAREFVETIERHIKRLNLLVSDLLTLARIEADGAQPTLRPVSIRAVLAEVIDAVQPKADQRDVELDIKLSKRPWALADSRALTQVLRNLIENGINYSNPGGHVVVRTRRALNGRLLIAVEDRGIGIEPAHLMRIFERFYRVDTGRSREVGGTGLGLAIVKHLVQAMNGDIDVTSTPGKGSTFTISLKAAEPPRRRARPPGDAPLPDPEGRPT